MKKLSLLLFAFCVSIAGWAQDNSDAGLAYTLNPYAYDLSIKSWDPATRQLTVRFKLNAPPNLDDNGTKNTGPYNTGIADKEPNGIQIYAVDQSGNEYRIGGLGRDVIQNGINNGYFEYTMDLSAGTTHEFSGDAKALPVDEPLTWKVRVKGRSNQHVDAYKVPRHVTARPTDFKRPRRVMGVGVGTNPLSPNFGRLFTSEADDGVSSNGSSYFGWLYDALYDPDYKSSHMRMPALLEYTPQLKFVGVHKKYIDDSDNNSHFSLQMYSEPHRVRVSEDGRIFVSSYHQGAGAAVKEYLGNNTFRTVIGFDANENNDNQSSTGYPSHSKYNRRAIDFDVKGSGDDLKIIVAWIKPKGAPAIGDNAQWNAVIDIYEYNVGKNYDLHQTNNGTLVAKYTESNVKNHLCGYLFQAYFNSDYTAERALVGLAYGSGENDIWLKVDPGMNFTETKQAQIMYFNKQIGQSPQKVTELAVSELFQVNEDKNTGRLAGCYYGGGSIIVKDNKLYTYAAKSATGNAGVLRVYTINSGTLTKDRDIALGVSSPWANGFAIDYANNLYLVSEWMGNIKTISLPYSGVIETPAPANSTFSLADPVPNIYATNLRYEAVEGAPKYKFSFNVNTTPKYAEIRFYKSYDSMKRSMSAINADNFKGGKTDRDANLYCYYPITSGLKQGKIEVEFGMVGGIINQQTKELTPACLPRGELYWSVYVETDKSSAFAPIYRQPLTGTDAHYHMHAIVNNNPETDQFGTIYGAQEDKRVASTNKRSSLMIYEINDNGSDVHDLNNTTRYVKKQEYLYNTSDAAYNAKPRRMDIAPDGTIYIAHEGKDNQNSIDLKASWQYGGIYAWNPNDPLTNGKLKLSLFSNNKIGTSSGVALYPHVNGNDTTWKMYAANSYGEFTTHGTYYTHTNQRDVNKFGWNGFVEYEKGVAKNWNSWLDVDADQEYKLKQGDGSGNNSLVAMDKGVWICQHREHSNAVKVAMGEVFADNRGTLVLSFVPYGNYTADADFGPRTWRSSTTDGGRTRNESGTLTVKDDVKSLLTQESTSILQSTPGAGMAYRKINGIDYLFINNHDGDIVQLQVDWDSSKSLATPLVHVSKAKVLTTPAGVKGILTVNGDTKKNIRWKTAAVSSMCFDFAGNLVTTTGNSYLKLEVAQLLNNAGDQDAFNTPEGGQSIIIYTMPYDRTNAREIQAPKSNIFIPERFAQLNMTTKDIQDVLDEHKEHNSECYVDLYRPLQGGMFNTICLPFQLITTKIPHDHPLYGAEFMRFTGVELNDNLGGEKILTLVFADLEDNTMAANVPHIVKPKSNIKSIIPFDWVMTLAQNTTVTKLSGEFDNGNSITYQGILPKTWVEAVYEQTTNLPLRLILVADNRLAALTGDGDMYGFRGYFDLAKSLPSGTKINISARKDTPTNTTIVVDGKKVNVEKYLREGRVYIRVGDSLYTIDGQVVK